jgi:hypothetical protein
MKAKFYIDAERLEKASACGAGVGDFRRLFGNRKVPVTRANLTRAAKAGLNVMWLFDQIDYQAESVAYASVSGKSDNYEQDPAYLDALWEVIKAKEENR